MNERADRSAGPELAEQRDRLSALFETHADRLYRLARRLVPSSDDALDLVQDTFLKATRTSAAIPRGRSDEEAWLVRVLVNVRRDQWRREKSEGVTSSNRDTRPLSKTIRRQRFSSERLSGERSNSCRHAVGLSW